MLVSGDEHLDWNLRWRRPESDQRRAEAESQLAINMSATYLVERNGAESGPYSHKEVLALLERGCLSPSDMICFARKWRWLGRDRWFPVEWLRHPPTWRDIRIPRSTVLSWACIVGVLLALVLVRVLQK